VNAEVHTLAGPYALDALPDDERRFFEAHLSQCDACREEVGELRATAARLADDAYETPPASLRENLLSAIDRTRQDSPMGAVNPVRSRDRRMVRWLAPAAAALAVVAVALGALLMSTQGRADQQQVVLDVLADPTARTVALDAPEGTQARLVWSDGRAVFVADGLSAVPDDQLYALWLIRDGQPAIAGTFSPEAGRVTHLVDGEVGDGVAVGVTVEPAGSAFDAPTGDILITGEVA